MRLGTIYVKLMNGKVMDKVEEIKHYHVNARLTKIFADYGAILLITAAKKSVQMTLD